MKLFTAVILFIMGLGMMLGIIYVMNYALVQENALLYDLIPEDYLSVYRILNMIWSAMPFLVTLALLIRTINREGTYG